MSAAEREKVQKYLNDVMTGAPEGIQAMRETADPVIEIEQEIGRMSCPFFLRADSEAGCIF